MPQFDFFAWASMSFWTVFSFHIFYLLLLRWVLSPVAELQKAIQKLFITFSSLNSYINLKDTFFLYYFKKN